MGEASDGAADGHVHEARGHDRIVRAAEPAPPTDGRARRIWQPPADALPAAAVAHPRSVDVAVRVAAGTGAERIALRGTRDGRGDARDPGAAAVGQGDDGERARASSASRCRWASCCWSLRLLLFRLRHSRFFGGKSAPAPAVVVAKPAAAPAAPAALVVEPVQSGQPAVTPGAEAPPTRAGDSQACDGPGHGSASAAHGAAGRQSGSRDCGVRRRSRSRRRSRTSPRSTWPPTKRRGSSRSPPSRRSPSAPATPSAPKPRVAKEPQATDDRHPAKPAKKPAKAWVDPFAQLVARRAMA